jgi:hypothetical protein
VLPALTRRIERPHRTVGSFRTKTNDRPYRLSTEQEGITLTAQDIRDVYEWALLHMRQIEREARSLLDEPEPEDEE